MAVCVFLYVVQMEVLILGCVLASLSLSKEKMKMRANRVETLPMLLFFLDVCVVPSQSSCFLALISGVDQSYQIPSLQMPQSAFFRPCSGRAELPYCRPLCVTFMQPAAPTLLPCPWAAG